MINGPKVSYKHFIISLDEINNYVKMCENNNYVVLLVYLNGMTVSFVTKTTMVKVITIIEGDLTNQEYLQT